MDKNIKDFIKNQIMEHMGRCLGFLGGLLVAILMLCIGFWSTIFIMICVSLGIYIGGCFDTKDTDGLTIFLDKIQRFLPPYRRF